MSCALQLLLTAHVSHRGFHDPCRCLETETHLAGQSWVHLVVPAVKPLQSDATQSLSRGEYELSWQATEAYVPTTGHKAGDKKYHPHLLTMMSSLAAATILLLEKHGANPSAGLAPWDSCHLSLAFLNQGRQRTKPRPGCLTGL